MSALKFLASACMVLWFGWLLFQPAQDEPAPRTMDKIGQQVEQIYDRAVDLYDQEHTEEQVCATNSTPTTPDHSLGTNTQQEPLDSGPGTRFSSSGASGRTGTAENQKMPQPERPLDKTPAETLAAPDREEPAVLRSNEPSRNVGMPLGLDREPASPAIDHESDLAGYQEHHAASLEKTPSEPSEAEIDGYLERFHTAGTHATENLEKVSRLLGR